MASARAGESDEQAYARAMRDPEVQQIMADPAFQSILQQAQQDPASLQQHMMKNADVRKKVEVLVRAGCVPLSLSRSLSLSLLRLSSFVPRARADDPLTPAASSRPALAERVLPRRRLPSLARSSSSSSPSLLALSSRPRTLSSGHHPLFSMLPPLSVQTSPVGINSIADSPARASTASGRELESASRERGSRCTRRKSSRAALPQTCRASRECRRRHARAHGPRLGQSLALALGAALRFRTGSLASPQLASHARGRIRAARAQAAPFCGWESHARGERPTWEGHKARLANENAACWARSDKRRAANEDVAGWLNEKMFIDR